MRSITTLIAGVVAAGALGLSGCAGPAPAPEPTPAPAHGWQFFADDIPADRRGTFETVGREYGLSSDPQAPQGDPDSRALILHRATGRVVARFQPELPQRQAYRAVFTDRHAMILDGSYAKAEAPDPAKDQSVLWRVDLAGGQRTRFQPTAVASLSLSEQMTEQATETGPAVVVPAVGHDQRSCLISVDVATLRDTLLHCAPPGATILRVDHVGGGLSWLQANGSGYADCKSRWWREPSGAITQLAPDAGCGIWDGVRLGGWTVAASRPRRESTSTTSRTPSPATMDRPLWISAGCSPAPWSRAATTCTGSRRTTERSRNGRRCAGGSPATTATRRCCAPRATPAVDHRRAPRVC